MVVAEADPPDHSHRPPLGRSSPLVSINMWTNKLLRLLKCPLCLMHHLMVTLRIAHTMVMQPLQPSSLMVKAITTAVLPRTRQHQHTTQATPVVLATECVTQQW